MRIFTAVFLFILTVLPHFSELGSLERTYGQTSTFEQPSTSGRTYNVAKMKSVDPAGTIVPRTNRVIPMHDLYYINKEKVLVPILTNNFFAGTTKKGDIFTIIIDDFLYALCNKKRQILILSEEDYSQTFTTIEYVESMGVNKYSQKKFFPKT
ncbi:uncharacterized protein LOC117177414 [Belonocnema kinseyi]|uniref:uncharacterized protein LOC117177414 n=1 Tax=Belonocnema kinseyi TaxID=2817044 RepID=UPI00143CF2D9|nr:uncharacterized protein LOC117177414 [Belonocnema kinseyi]